MKVFAAFLLVLLIALQYRLWLSDDGVRSLVSLQRSVAAQKKENDELARRNSELAGEVKDLKEGYSAVEEHARYDLGMVGSSESFYQIIDQANRPTAPDPVPTPSVPVQRTSH
jgi:cell division protein FtsB